MIKTLKKEQQLKGKISISQDFLNGVSGHISRAEKEKYKPYVREYIDAKKITVTTRGLTNCLPLNITTTETKTRNRYTQIICGVIKSVFSAQKCR
jgi:hypothetical protein